MVAAIGHNVWKYWRDKTSEQKSQREKWTRRMQRLDKRASESDIGQNWMRMKESLTALAFFSKLLLGVVFIGGLGVLFAISGHWTWVFALLAVVAVIRSEERGGVIALLLAAIALGCWLSEAIVGLDHLRSDNHGIYAGNWVVPICTIVTAALFRGSTSDRFVLFTSLPASLMAVLILKLMGVNPHLGGLFGTIILLALAFGIVFVAVMVFAWAGFGNASGTVLALVAIAAVWLNWLVFSENGTRDGFLFDTHFFQFVACPLLIVAGFTLLRRSATPESAPSPEEVGPDSEPDDVEDWNEQAITAEFSSPAERLL